MPRATLFVDHEGDEPTTLTDELLDEELAPFEADETFSLRELIRDHTNAGVETYDVYSVFSMLAAVWALQQIQQGADPVATASGALEALTTSGDFEDRCDYEHPDGFTIQSVVKTDPDGYAWASEYPPAAATEEAESDA